MAHDLLAHYHRRSGSPKLPLPLVRRRYAHQFPVLGDGPPGYTDPVGCEFFHYLLIAGRAGGIFIPDDLLDLVLD